MTERNFDWEKGERVVKCTPKVEPADGDLILLKYEPNDSKMLLELVICTEKIGNNVERAKVRVNKVIRDQQVAIKIRSSTFKPNCIAMRMPSDTPQTGIDVDFSLQKELDLHLELDHENILGILKCFQNDATQLYDSKLFLVTEFSSLGSLMRPVRHIIKKSKTKNKEVARLTYETYLNEERFEDVIKVIDFLRGIVNALCYLHSNLIAHLNLCPENIIMFKEDWKLIPKLTNFGLSQKIQSQQDRMQFSIQSKSCRFSSPFRTHNRSFNICKDDVWSVGALLHCMLTGQLLFENRKAKPGKVHHCPFKMPQVNQRLNLLPNDSGILGRVKQICVLDEEVRPTMEQVMKLLH